MSDRVGSFEAVVNEKIYENAKTYDHSWADYFCRLVRIQMSFSRKKMCETTCKQVHGPSEGA